MAWAFITGSIPTSAFALLGGTWAYVFYVHPRLRSAHLISSWTIWYDTIYACQDKKDDVKAGVKSTALLFGNSIKLVLAFFASIMMGGLILAGILNGHELPYFLLSVGGGSLYLAVQLYAVDTNSPKSCWAAVSLSTILLFIGLSFMISIAFSFTAMDSISARSFGLDSLLIISGRPKDLC